MANRASIVLSNEQRSWALSTRLHYPRTTKNPQRPAAIIDSSLNNRSFSPTYATFQCPSPFLPPRRSLLTRQGWNWLLPSSQHPLPSISTLLWFGMTGAS